MSYTEDAEDFIGLGHFVFALISKFLLFFLNFIYKQSCQTPCSLYILFSSASSIHTDKN